jgi:tetratricopeptide (TPR) repeat protein
MATTLDRWGVPFTVDPDSPTDDEAVVGDTIVDYLTMAPGIEQRFDDLGRGGPMAKAVLAQLLTQAHRPDLTATAAGLAAAATEEVEAGTVTVRERLHVEAATAWAAGRTDEAIDRFGTILGDHPTDALAMRARYLLLFSAGRIDDMLSTVTDNRPAWSDDLPVASLLDGMEAFALEELGRYREAEPLARRGADRDPTDLWAIHAVAHVLEMQERRGEGVAWLEGRDEVFEAGGGFARHLWWHQALQLWALGRTGDALALYDDRVYPAAVASQEGLDLSNAISLLARLEMLGVDVGHRWSVLVEPSTVRVGQHSHPFNDTHFVLALARAGEHRRAADHIEGMRAWADRGDGAAAVLRQVGLATAEGLAHYGAGRWADAAAVLGPVEDEFWRLGGSHAQRQIYHRALATAAGESAAGGAR